MITAVDQPKTEPRGNAVLAAIVSTRPSDRRVDLAMVVARIGLTWIFFYYGGAKLFGWFGGAGIHGTSVYFANTAHLHPGGFFAVLGGLTEFAGAIAIALGLAT